MGKAMGALGIALGSLMLGLAAQPAMAGDHFDEKYEVTGKTLLDRIQIEDLLRGYYHDFHTLGAAVATRYFAPDAVFDANGQVFRGREEIAKVYQSIADRPPEKNGLFQMMMGPPLIRIEGDRATAVIVWTGIMNDTLTAPPRFIEQGREYDILAKYDGHWRIRKRTIITDSGLPAQWLPTYVRRAEGFDPFADEPKP